MPESKLESAKFLSGIRTDGLKVGQKITMEVEVISPENCECEQVAAIDYVNFGAKTSFAGMFKVISLKQA